MTDDLIERTARAGADAGLVLSDEQWRAVIAIIAPAVLDMAAQTAIDPSDESSYLVADAILALKAQFQTETQV